MDPVRPRIRHFLRHSILAGPGRLRLWALVAALGTAPAGNARAADASGTSGNAELFGTIRCWGSGEMGPMLRHWERGFCQLHPQIRFSENLKGSETAHAALYCNVADLALTGKEALMLDSYGLFVRTHHYPLQIAVATGSFDQADRNFALAIFVNRENPITSITMRQLDGVFGSERTGGWDSVRLEWHPEAARGPEQNIRTWGQLGLTGEWADKPIHGFGYPFTSYAASTIDAGAMFFFRLNVLHGSDKWNFDIKEFEKGSEIAAAIGEDRYGIGYTGMCYNADNLKAVPIVDDRGKPIALTKATVASREYPLTRSVYICIDRDPARPADPKVGAFLRYVLSPEGQAEITADTGYSPLTASEAGNQLEKLQ